MYNMMNTYTNSTACFYFIEVNYSIIAVAVLKVYTVAIKPKLLYIC